MGESQGNRITISPGITPGKPDVLHFVLPGCLSPDPPTVKPIIVLGSTGSIGTQTLALVAEPDSGLQVTGLAAHSSWELLRDQVQETGATMVALADPAAATSIRPHLPANTTLFSGPGAMLELIAAADFEVAIHGVMGRAGLEASFALARLGKTLALANKESLVIAGELLIDAVAEGGGRLIPVDSEHSAIEQCLRGEDLACIRKVLLTASGGPLRQWSLEQIEKAPKEKALDHPTWEMGPRITIGSATLTNKAFEIIELHHLFGLDADRMGVVIHPQSIVHSMVEFVDGAVIAQMGPPDMRGPIHYALHHPTRVPSSLTGFDLDLFSNLTFEAPDFERFPALQLGFRCVEEGSTSGCCLNAADEVAVEAYLADAIQFGDIVRISQQVLDERTDPETFDLQSVLDADRWARSFAQDLVSRLSATTTP